MNLWWRIVIIFPVAQLSLANNVDWLIGYVSYGWIVNFAAANFKIRGVPLEKIITISRNHFKIVCVVDRMQYAHINDVITFTIFGSDLNLQVIIFL